MQNVLTRRVTISWFDPNLSYDGRLVAGKPVAAGWHTVSCLHHSEPAPFFCPFSAELRPA
jgi:hypothetical protein